MEGITITEAIDTGAWLECRGTILHLHWRILSFDRMNVEELRSTVNLDSYELDGVLWLMTSEVLNMSKRALDVSDLRRHLLIADGSKCVHTDFDFNVIADGVRGNLRINILMYLPEFFKTSGLFGFSSLSIRPKFRAVRGSIAYLLPDKDSEYYLRMNNGTIGEAQSTACSIPTAVFGSVRVIPIREAIETGAWFEHRRVTLNSDTLNSDPPDFRMRLLSFDRISVEKLSSAVDVSSLALEGGVLWLLRLEVQNVWKKSFRSGYLNDLLAIGDSDECLFEYYTDDDLCFHSELAKTSGLRRFNWSDFGHGLIRPKIPVTGAIAYLLPDEKSTYSVVVRFGIFREVLQDQY